MTNATFTKRTSYPTLRYVCMCPPSDEESYLQRRATLSETKGLSNFDFNESKPNLPGTWFAPKWYSFVPSTGEEKSGPFSFLTNTAEEVFKA